MFLHYSFSLFLLFLLWPCHFIFYPFCCILLYFLGYLVRYNNVSLMRQSLLSLVHREVLSCITKLCYLDAKMWLPNAPSLIVIQTPINAAMSLINTQFPSYKNPSMSCDCFIPLSSFLFISLSLFFSHYISIELHLLLVSGRGCAQVVLAQKGCAKENA